MESSRRRRRRRDNMPKWPKPTKTIESSSPIAGGATTSTVYDVPDHVLEVILLRLDSHASLIRAASACKRWCRVVADAGFLRRVHPLSAGPLILGHYHHDHHNQLVFLPSSTPGIGEHSRCQSLSLDFVPKLDGAWEVADSRDTLLLLSKQDWTTTPTDTSSISRNPDLVVCRPVTRWYKAISVPEPDQLAGRNCLGLFLVEGGGTGAGKSIGLSNFRVMAVLLREHMLVPGRGVPVACVYEGRFGWRDVSCAWSGGDISIPNTTDSFCFAGRANGCLYWAIQDARAALVLDEATTGVSLVDLPEAIHPWYPRSPCFRVIGGEEDDSAVSLRAVRLVANEVRVYARLRVGDEWVLQNLLPLPVTQGVHGAPWNAMIVAAHETYVVVGPRDSVRLFYVDLKTMAVELMPQGTMDCARAAYPYELPWPPTLDVEAAAAAAAAADNSNPNTVQGHTESTYYGFQRATQSIARLLWWATSIIVATRTVAEVWAATRQSALGRHMRCFSYQNPVV